MQKTIAILGLGCVLLAGCAAGPTTADTTASRDEAYIPTGSNIPRRDPKRSDIPTVNNGQLETLMRGAGAARPAP